MPCSRLLARRKESRTIGPICGNEVRLEPSRPPGDAPCPCCGHLLWFAPDKNAPSSVSNDLVQQNVIRLWLTATTRLADERFFDVLIPKLVKLLAARNGAVWIFLGRKWKKLFDYHDPSFPEIIQDEDNITFKSQLHEAAQHLIMQTLAVPSSRKISETAIENYFFLAVPVKNTNQTKAILTFVLEPGSSISDRFGKLRLLEEVCAQAAERICEVVDAAAAKIQQEKPIAKPKAKRPWWKAWTKLLKR